MADGYSALRRRGQRVWGRGRRVWWGAGARRRWWLLWGRGRRSARPDALGRRHQSQNTHTFHCASRLTLQSGNGASDFASSRSCQPSALDFAQSVGTWMTWMPARFTAWACTFYFTVPRESASTPAIHQLPVGRLPLIGTVRRAPRRLQESLIRTLGSGLSAVVWRRVYCTAGSAGWSAMRGSTTQAVPTRSCRPASANLAVPHISDPPNCTCGCDRLFSQRRAAALVGGNTCLPVRAPHWRSCCRAPTPRERPPARVLAQSRRWRHALAGFLAALAALRPPLLAGSPHQTPLSTRPPARCHPPSPSPSTHPPVLASPVQPAPTLPGDARLRPSLPTDASPHPRAIPPTHSTRSWYVS